MYTGSAIRTIDSDSLIRTQKVRISESVRMVNYGKGPGDGVGTDTRVFQGPQSAFFGWPTTIHFMFSQSR